MRKVTKHVYETTAGKPFDIKEDAEKHQARLDLAGLFEASEFDGDFTFGENAASAVFDHFDKFAEVLRPLLRKPRAAKAEATADEYEAQMGATPGMAAEATVKSKAGMELGAVAGMGVEANVIRGAKK